MKWSEAKTVSFRFKVEESCMFSRETKKDVKSPERTETNARVGDLGAACSSKVFTNFTEYIWKFEAKYDLSVICGVGFDCGSVDHFESVMQPRNSHRHEPQSKDCRDIVPENSER